MSTTKADLDNLQTIVIIIGGVVAVLTVIAIIFGILITVYVLRILKKLNEMSITVQNSRLDVRKTLEVVESSAKNNPVISSIFEDNLDGSEPASPIFTTGRMYQPSPSPVPFKHAVSVLRGDDYDRNRNARRPGPPVPPKRAQSFYDNKNSNAYY